MLPSTALVCIWESSAVWPKCIGTCTQMEDQEEAPGLGLGQSWLLWPFEKWTGGWKRFLPLPFFVSLCLPNKQNESLKIFICLFGKQNDREREKKRLNLLLVVHLPNGYTTMIGPDESRRLELLPGCCVVDRGLKQLGHQPLLTRVHYQETDWEAEQPTLKPTLQLDAGVANCSLTCCITTLTTWFAFFSYIIFILGS